MPSRLSRKGLQAVYNKTDLFQATVAQINNVLVFVLASTNFQFMVFSCTATDDLLSSFESPPSRNGHSSLVPPSYEEARKIPPAGMKQIDP